MKKKTKIIISVVVILAVAIAGAIAAVTYKTAQAAKATLAITTEIAALDDYTNAESGDFDFDEINAILNRRVIESGNYAELEDCTKKLYSDIYGGIEDYYAILDNDFYANMLNTENLSADGPDFEASKKYINESKETINNTKNLFLSLSSQSTLDKYLEGTSLNSVQQGMFQGFAQVWSEQGNNLIEIMDSTEKDIIASEKVIDFLIANKGKWTVKGDMIYFDTQNLADEYNAIIKDAIQ